MCHVLIYYRFDSDTEVSGISQTKSSVAKGIRQRLLKDYPPIEPYLDDIVPKKEALNIIKWYVLFSELLVFNSKNCSHDHIELLAVKGELLFFRQRVGPYIPCLKLLHKCMP